MEANLLHFTLWNYNPLNDNTFGDYWNGEDFSIYSRTISGQPRRRTVQRRSLDKCLVTMPSISSPKKAFDNLELISSDSDSNQKNDMDLVAQISPNTPFDITAAHFLSEGYRQHYHNIGYVNFFFS